MGRRRWKITCPDSQTLSEHASQGRGKVTCQGWLRAQKLDTRLGVTGRAGHASGLVTSSKTQHASRGHEQGKSRVRAGYELKNSTRVTGRAGHASGLATSSNTQQCVSGSRVGHASGLATSSNTLYVSQSRGQVTRQGWLRAQTTVPDSSCVHAGDELKPLSQSVAQGGGQCVYVAENDVEGERKLLHVGLYLWQLARAEYGHLDVEYGVLVHRVI